jgi:hypothetical protein
MKILYFLLISLLFFSNLKAQTAEEIIAKTKYTYRHLSNYVDESEFIIPSIAGKKYDQTRHYFLAIDSAKNVNHWFNETSMGNNRGYTYTKSSGQEEGILKRKFEDSETRTYTLAAAAATLGGGGYGILHLVASLLYSDFYFTQDSSTTSRTLLDNYTLLERLQDSIIDNQPCYVIKLTKEYEITQDMIDHTKQIQDSMNYVRAKAKTPTAERSAFIGSSTYNDEPGTRTSVLKYFIRLQDNLIVRQDGLRKNGNESYYVMNLKMNPKVNVENFGYFLSEQ